jgi:hypothetical protein
MKAAAIRTYPQRTGMNPSSFFRNLSQVGVAVFCFLCFFGCCNAELVALADDTFEHQTQASIGSTTGSWLVLFYSESCFSCSDVKSKLQELDQDSEVYDRGIVLGSVNVHENSLTASRFQIRQLPSMIYLHKGSMYRYPSQEDQEFSVDLKAFVLNEFASQTAERIPEPITALSQLWEFLNKEQGTLIGFAIIGMAIMLVGTILVLLYALLVSSSSSGGKNKQKKK